MAQHAFQINEIPYIFDHLVGRVVSDSEYAINKPQARFPTGPTGPVQNNIRISMYQYRLGR